MNFMHLGARMACINSDGKIVIWSPLPWGPHVIEALQLLTGKTSTDANDYNVTHIVVANLQHDMGVRSVKPQFPHSKVIGAHTLQYDSLDYKVNSDLGNKPVKLQDISAANGETVSVYEKLEFVYLSKHKNRELVVYENKHKVLFESDLLITVGDRGPTNTLEQYSEATGFTDGYNPHTGRALIGNFFYPQGWVSQWIQRRINGFKFPEGIEGCKAILLWDSSEPRQLGGKKLFGNIEAGFWVRKVKKEKRKKREEEAVYCNCYSFFMLFYFFLFFTSSSGTAHCHYPRSRVSLFTSLLLTSYFLLLTCIKEGIMY